MNDGTCRGGILPPEGCGVLTASPDPTKQRAKKTVGLVSLFFPNA